MKKKMIWNKPTSIFEAAIIAANYRKHFDDDHSSKMKSIRHADELLDYVVDNEIWVKVNSV